MKSPKLFSNLAISVKSKLFRNTFSINIKEKKIIYNGFPLLYISDHLKEFTKLNDQFRKEINNTYIFNLNY